LTETRCGLVALLGRPNVGKSTLANALVRAQVAITSSRPQTTRRMIRGIYTKGEQQLIVVDLPGVHRAKTLLGEKLNQLAGDLLFDVDVVAVLFPADEAIGKGDRGLAEQAFQIQGVIRLAIVTKTELVPKSKVVTQLLEVSALGDWDHVFPVSALEGFQVDELRDLLLSMLPVGPHLFPAGASSDLSVGELAAEVIRGSALEKLRDELPHSLAVTIDELQQSDAATDIYASLWVERDSQKGIVIGKGGSLLGQIGTAARLELSEQLGTRVRVFLQVRIAKDWQNQPKQLGRLGFSV
jgi:GTP-binding protein Era